MYNVKVSNLLYTFSIVFQIHTKINFVFIKKFQKKSFVVQNLPNVFLKLKILFSIH